MKLDLISAGRNLNVVPNGKWTTVYFHFFHLDRWRQIIARNMSGVDRYNASGRGEPNPSVAVAPSARLRLGKGRFATDHSVCTPVNGWPYFGRAPVGKVIEIAEAHPVKCV